MTLLAKHYRLMAQVAVGILVLVMLFALHAFSQTADLRRQVQMRAAVQRDLVGLEQAALEMAQLAGRWAVGGAMSQEIRATLTRETDRVVFAAPRLIGAHRFHSAEVFLVQGEVAAFLTGLEKIEGLPVRVFRLELGVDDANRGLGVVTVAWLEAL